MRRRARGERAKTSVSEEWAEGRIQREEGRSRSLRDIRVASNSAESVESQWTVLMLASGHQSTEGKRQRHMLLKRQMRLDTLHPKTLEDSKFRAASAVQLETDPIERNEDSER